jgi:uncharacterized protein (DUF4415 family)/uncharacterized DUF497 family protein
MRWTWDPKKAEANRAKHGVSFETAKAVFADPLHLSQLDPHSDGDRWQTVGMVGPVLLLVVHTCPKATKTRLAASSALARPRRTKGKPMKKKVSEALTPAQRAELESLARLPDDAIDMSDAPEVLDWSSAKRGVFYRPVKQQLTLRLDADVVAWFKAHTKSAKGYQTRINQALREYVQKQAARRVGSQDGSD